jgi:hypothetical protein
MGKHGIRSMIKQDADHFGAQKLPSASQLPEPMREGDKATMLSTSPAANGLAQIAYGHKPGNGGNGSRINGAFQSEPSALSDAEADRYGLGHSSLRRSPANAYLGNEGSLLWSLNVVG